MGRLSVLAVAGALAAAFLLAVAGGTTVRAAAAGTGSTSLDRQLDDSAMRAHAGAFAALLTPVSNVSVVNGSPSAGAGARTQYVVRFDASATGGLSGAANSHVTVTFPTGTGFGGYVSGQVFDVDTGLTVGSCGNPVGLTIECGLFSNGVVNAGDEVRVTFNGLTNPSSTGPHTLQVSTTSDTDPQTSAPYNVAAANQLTGLSVVNGSPSAGAGARTQYVVRFDASATGGLSGAANSHVTVTFPTGTGFGGYVSGQVFDVDTGLTVGSCGNPVGLTIECGLFSNGVVNAGDEVRVTFNGLTNPSSTGPHTLQVSTTSDTDPQTSAPYNVAAANQLTDVTLTLDSPVAGATTRWVTHFVASATGGLSGAANSHVTVTFPTGTGFGGYASGQVFDVDTGLTVGSCGNPVGLTIECGLFSNGVVNAGDEVRVTFNGLTNPSSQGPYTIDASTTSDTPPETSSPNAGGDGTPPDTTIDSGPSGQTNDSTPTFAFSSSEPAGAIFQCRFDSAAFGPCTSPHTPSAALADGPHTFEVRATDAAGNVDQTAASRAFTVATPLPPDTTPPDATITAGPSGPTDDSAPTFEFSSNEAGSTFQCSVDGGSFLDCSSPFTAPSLPGGSHTFAVRARDAAGNVGTATTVSFSVALQTLEDLPVPTIGEEVNVGPVPGSGPVLIGVPSGTATARARASQKGITFVPLTEARQIPTGSFLDTSRGTVQLVSATGSAAKTQSGRFSSGLFQVLQSRKRRDKGMTELRLKGSSFNRCRTRRRGRSASAAQLSRRTVRRLRSNARGRFRTRGRHSAATVRGTVWITADRCDGTLTTVKRGRVAVRDLRRKRTITLRRGKSYLARAPQRR